MNGKRILVLGSPGSGKSTFASELGGITSLPLIHLDNIWWKPDRTHITRDEFDLRLSGILSGGEWILDGDYSRTYEVRIKACDTVIFLDYPTEVCLDGITERLGKKRADIPWTESRPDPELEALVRGYRVRERPKLLELKEEHPGKEWLVFTSREQAAEYLERITKNHGD